MEKKQTRSNFSIEVRKVYRDKGTGKFSEKPCLGYDPTYILQLVPQAGNISESPGELVYALSVSTPSRAEALEYIDKNMTPIQEDLCARKISEGNARVKLQELGNRLNVDTVLSRGQKPKRKLGIEFLFQTPVTYGLSTA